MKQKIGLALVGLCLIGFLLVGCSEETEPQTLVAPAEGIEAEVEDLAETEQLPEDVEAEASEAEAPPTEPAPASETATGSDAAFAQMAGNWIWYEFNPDNAFLLDLHSDGSWTSPGPLVTDVVQGGRLYVTPSAGGYYNLRLVITHSTSAYDEIGSDYAAGMQLRYHTGRDRIEMDIPSEGGAMHTVWFTRIITS